MKKVGYLTKKKVKGNYYIYVRTSFREKNKVKHKYIYSFGKMPQALEKMYILRDKPELFPESLIVNHFTLHDLHEWILTIETGITSKGNPFNFN